MALYEFKQKRKISFFNIDNPVLNHFFAENNLTRQTNFN